jgi:hypothetical protein
MNRSSLHRHYLEHPPEKSHPACDSSGNLDRLRVTQIERGLEFLGDILFILSGQEQVADQPALGRFEQNKSEGLGTIEPLRKRRCRGIRIIQYASQVGDSSHHVPSLQVSRGFDGENLAEPTAET